MRDTNKIKGELHIWLIKPNEEYYDNFIDTGNAIENGENIIHTTQTYFLHFSYLIDKGYRLFVHVDYVKQHEITLGECEGTKRDIKEGHNIEKMLYAGEFDWF